MTPKYRAVTMSVMLLLACLPNISPVSGVGASPAVQTSQPRPDGWSAATHGSGSAADYARVFSLDRVHELRISITPTAYRSMQEDLEKILPMGAAIFAGMAGRADDAGGRGLARGLRMTPRDPIYVPATIRHDGRAWTSVGFRYKGNSSLVFGSMFRGRMSFRLNFDRFEDDQPQIANQRFYGFKELTFSSNFEDPSQLREALANEIFRDRGVPAPRVAFYRVLVDTGDGFTSWGLYTAVEDPADEAMRRAQFGGASGNLYKPDGPGADWSRFDAPSFEKKTNRSETGYADIKAAIAALHADEPPNVWRANLEKVFDADGFLRWLAVNQVVDNWDTYGRLAHNYYLYADPGHGGRLSWIPWDNNYTFGLSPFGFGNLAGVAVGRGGGVPLFSSNQDVLYERLGPGWPLISKLLADDTYRARYRAHLRAAVGGLYSRDALVARVHAWQKLLAPIVETDRPVRSFVPVPASYAETIDGPNGLLAMIERRRVLIEAALGQ